MNQGQLDLLIDMLDHYGLDYSLRPAYSGRSMYGQTTIGVVVDASLPSITYRLEAELEDEDEEFFDGPKEVDQAVDWLTLLKILRHDNMGKQYIWY